MERSLELSESIHQSLRNILATKFAESAKGIGSLKQHRPITVLLRVIHEKNGSGVSGERGGDRRGSSSNGGRRIRSGKFEGFGGQMGRRRRRVWFFVKSASSSGRACCEGGGHIAKYIRYSVGNLTKESNVKSGTVLRVDSKEQVLFDAEAGVGDASEQGLEEVRGEFLVVHPSTVTTSFAARPKHIKCTEFHTCTALTEMRAALVEATDGPSKTGIPTITLRHRLCHGVNPLGIRECLLEMELECLEDID
ncbi:Tryptophan synthase beta chain 2, chloroplastic [Senna tora]|uniref:Tryptophan synthase beta chain 2, chloroplastic n=1 Tax=Senna tora TaxID=362788 RepID=A0A834T653_9FABA|nr:Tryptophan synthase beta chain 2, chloroplastic [Senna tora]